MTSIEDYLKEEGIEKYTIERDSTTLKTDVYVDCPDIEYFKYTYDLWCKRNNLLAYANLYQMSDIEVIHKSRQEAKNKAKKEKKGLLFK